MASRQSAPIVIAGIRGRDGSLSSVGLPPEVGGTPMDMVAEAFNVVFYRAGVARKRAGAASATLTFGSGGPFASGIRSLGHKAASWLWAVDGSGQIAYKHASSGGWVEPALTDAVVVTKGVMFVHFDGLTYIAYDNAAARLAVWDGSTIRRTGMATPAAPTVADTGAGSYAATLRYYRVRYTVQSGGVTVRRGEASASQSFTPSGGGTAARVTKPAATSPAEGETHWELEVSLDNAVWYVLATTAVGTTTYDDSAATTTYASNDAAPLAGAYTNWTDVRFLVADENRLIGMNLNGRVFFSPVKGTTSAAFLDAERVPDTVEQKNYIDWDGDVGDDATGIAGPFQGSYWTFRRYGMNKLTPTGIDTAPFRRTTVFKDLGVGCLRQQTIVQAVDEAGQPAMYWLSEVGPYRLSNLGLQYLGRDIQDIWDTLALNQMGGPNGACHGIYHAAKQQIWWWVTTNASTGVHDRVIVFDTRLGRPVNGEVRGGWSWFSGGQIPASVCSTTMDQILDGASTNAIVPFVGLETGTTILRCETGTADAGTAFQAYVEVPERPYAGMTHQSAVTGAEMAARSQAGATLRLTLSRNQGAESRTNDATLAIGDVRRRFEGAEITDADTVKVQLGDASAVSSEWVIDAVSLTVERRAQRFP